MIGQKGMPAHFGGVERHVHELSVRLADRGFDVTVYAREWYTDPTINIYKGVHVKHVKSIHSKHLDTISHTFFAILDAIKQEYDVVHFHGVGPSLLSWMVRLFSPKTKVINTFHCIDRKHAKWGLIARLALFAGEFAACRFAHTTISVSKTIQQYARDVYDRPTTYIPNAVPVARRTRNVSELKQWNLESGKYFMMVSRLIPHKGAHYLIEAYKGLDTDMPLVIVGDGHHTEEYVASLKKMAKGHNIIFTGFQSGDALHQLYSHAAMMVHPSDNEGLPIAVLEGMSYSLPVLVSDIPEHRDLIHSYKFLFQAANVASLKEAMTVLLKEKKTTLREEGRKNKAIVAAEYQWSDIIDRVIDVYKDAPMMSAQPMHS